MFVSFRAGFLSATEKIIGVAEKERNNKMRIA